MGTKRNVDMSSTEDTVKVVDGGENQQASITDSATAASTEAAVAKKPKQLHARSHRYQSQRSLVDKTKEYDVFAAVELVKKLSYSKFSGTVTADLTAREIGDLGKVTFPHSTGKVVRVAIADDEVLAQIEKGIMDFDVLLSEPSFVPKLAKLARVLGPKGLMPNPKNGTITNKPKEKKAELEKGSTTLQTERKQAVAHIVVGKTDMDTKALVENITAIIEAAGTRILRCSISATMSPSIKVKIG